MNKEDKEFEDFDKEQDEMLGSLNAFLAGGKLPKKLDKKTKTTAKKLKKYADKNIGKKKLK